MCFSKLITCFAAVIMLFGCSKGDNYCEPPEQIEGFLSIQYYNTSSRKVRVELKYNQLFNNDQKNTLFSFSTPDIFENPRGDYQEIILGTKYYEYQLKDPTSPPDSVKITAYAFNDCGESNCVSTWLRYL